MLSRRKLLKTTLITLVTFFLVANTFLPAFAFTDLQGHWAEKDIGLLSAKGLIAGYPDGSFQPERGITRAELARLLISALNMEESAWALETSQQLFRDVPPKHWAKGYIQLAWELGIVVGYDNGLFRPEQVINRAEMATILLRALRYIGYGEQDVDFVDGLPDWAAENIHQAARWGLVSGFADGTFRPLEPVTRSQAVVFLNRLLRERGNKFELYGQITGINNEKITLSIGGEAKELPVGEDCVFYLQDRPLNISQAQGRLPLTGFLAFGKGDKISFVDFVPQPWETGITVAFQGRNKIGQQDHSPSLLQTMNFNLGEKGDADVSDPAGSIEITKKAMNALELSQGSGVEGREQIIAIIDSGIDPGHPDLLTTSHGQRKVADWANFTDEGKVKLSGTVSADSSGLYYQGQNYTLPNLKSQSGVFRYGFLEEKNQNIDFNLNGSLDDQYLVVVADTKKRGVYDTAVINTRGHRNLTEERQLEVFSARGQYASFVGPYDNEFNFVITHIAPSGEEITLGYDALGHGTQVAGVAAANGRMEGVAPGAQLLIAKVLDQDGVTHWGRLQEAIRWAVEQGAQIINLSLGYYRDETAGHNTLTKIIDDYSDKGIIFTIAAGNEGPGIGTVTTPGNAKNAISVGAYITPEMWLHDYGYKVERPTLWYFSSGGPRDDGLMVPTIVAPGSVVSTWPMSAGNGYRLGEGTSIAAPHVAGSLALMRESGEKLGIELDAKTLKHVLADSSQRLDGFSEAEVGYGAFDANQTWRQLRRESKRTSPLQGYAYNRQLGFGEGLYFRDLLPGDVPYYVLNQGPEQTVFWSSSAPWLQPLFQVTFLPPAGSRELPMEYVLPEEPGIYTGWLEGRGLTSQSPDIRLMTTVIKPSLLEKGNGYRQDFSGRLLAGEYKRYFLKVPPGATSFQLSLSVPMGGESGYQGRVRFHLNRPNGIPYGMSNWTGVASQGTKGQEWASLMVEKPEPGVWEVVVYSSAALSTYDKKESQYRLRTQLSGVEEQEYSSPNSPYLMTVTPKTLVPNQPNYITLHVRDKKTFKPFTGTITINNQLYRVNRGQVTFTTVPQKTELSLEVEI